MRIFGAVETNRQKDWVEPKMRSVVGHFGKTAADGTTSTNPLGRLILQLNEALKKPAADERLIFIDLNAEMTVNSYGKPLWIESAARRLERYEKEDLAAGTVAYVFVTNFAFRRYFHDPAMFAGFSFGPRYSGPKSACRPSCVGRVPHQVKA